MRTIITVLMTICVGLMGEACIETDLAGEVDNRDEFVKEDIEPDMEDFKYQPPDDDPGSGYSCGEICSYDASCNAGCEQYPLGTITCGEYGTCIDVDGDGVLYYYDNCVDAFNPLQEDCDDDGIGDVCDLQNARYEISGSWNVCYIERRWAALLAVSLWEHTEALFVDNSDCQAPDQWMRDKQSTGCYGFVGTGEDCCEMLYDPWDSAICDNYWRSNQCH